VALNDRLEVERVWRGGVNIAGERDGRLPRSRAVQA